MLHEGIWGPVCTNGTSPATASAVCRHLGCGTGGRLEELVPAEGSEPAWLSWVSCEEGARSFWRCPSAPWQLRDCDTTGITHIVCDEDTGDSSEATSPAPGSSHRDRHTSTNGFVRARCPLTAAMRSPWGLTLPITAPQLSPTALSPWLQLQHPGVCQHSRCCAWSWGRCCAWPWLPWLFWHTAHGPSAKVGSTLGVPQCGAQPWTPRALVPCMLPCRTQQGCCL